MLGNYFKIAWRNFNRNRGFWLLNIGGLAVGLACCILIGMFIADEWSYDIYHSRADRIYRVTTELGGENGDASHSASSVYALTPAIRENVAGVRHVTRFYGNHLSSTLVEHGETRLNVDGIFTADASVFKIFDFELLRGDPATALERPNTIVISESAARKFFGEEDPLGQTLTRRDDAFEVTGVMADVPENSHFTFDYLTSFSTIEGQPHFREHGWNLLGFYTYILLEEGADEMAVARQINQLRGDGNQASERIYHLQPLTDIHLRSHLSSEIVPNSDIRYIYLFGSIALLVLVIACINYVNLTTSIVNRRVTQVGVRKVLGAQNRHIIRQFLAESLAIGAAAMLTALFLIELSLPWFNRITQKSLALDYTGFGLLLPLAALAVSLMAGIYPAVIYTRVRPGDALRGRRFSGDRPEGGIMRKGLVVFQFAVSIALIIGTITVQRQLDYVQQERLGFDKENLVVLHNAEMVGDRYDAFKETLLGYSGIRQVTTSTNVPGQLIYNEYRMKPEERSGKNPFSLAYTNVDMDFLETLGLEVVQGRSFSSERGTDSEEALLVNEATVQRMGWENPLDQTLFGRQVIGVVRNYLIRSAQEEVPPSAYVPSSDPQRFIAARISGGNIPAAIEYLERSWSEFVPSRPLEFSFADGDIEALYRSEERLARVFISFTLLAIFVACLGLFGVAAYAAERRTKEIGIRKVLGATVADILALLNRDFFKLVALGMVVAAPVAWYGMNRWLADFAYRIEIGPGVFLLAGVAALLIAMATVSWQSLRAALANPVDSLRSE